MRPATMLLYRRRWTLFFQVPCAVLLAAGTVYSVFLAVAFDNRLFTPLSLFGAFCMFCLSWTLGRSALEAQRNREPAVAIDASGITDLRDDDPHPVPWHAMESVHINRRNCIVIRLMSSEKASALRVITLSLQRWHQGGDVVISLVGLGVNHYVLHRTLSAFHKAASNPALRRHSPNKGG